MTKKFITKTSIRTQEYTILKYQNSDGRIRPKTIGIKIREPHATRIYDEETTKLVQDGWKLVSFTKQTKSKERMFRQNNENLILKLIEVK
tara:strand:+ start:95 stop:364 length:270 start_codon:yes stop_codon:yes gene_type:complete